MFRWSYIVPRLLIVLAIFLFLHFGVDPLIKYAMVSSAESAIGAKVEIGGVQSSLVQGDVYLADIQVTDPRNPSHNLIEAKHALLNVDRDALLHRKYVVTEGKISGMQFGTDRQHDGSLSDDQRSQAEREAKMTEQLRRVGEQWLDGFLNRTEADLREEFETVRVTEELMRRWPAEYERLDADIVRWRRSLENLERVYDEMRVNPLRSVEYYQKRLAEMQQLQQEIIRIRREAERLRQQVGVDREAIVRAKTNDEQKIRDALRMENLDPQKLSEYLLGEDVANQVSSTLAWVQRGRQVLRFANAKPQTAGDRVYGEVIPFHNQKTPDILFRKLAFDGVTLHKSQDVQFQGTLHDVTTQPRKYDSPTRMSLATRGALEMQMEATFDRTGDEAVDRFEVTCPNLPQPEKTLGKTEQLAVTVSPGRSLVTIQLQLVEDQCQGTITFHQDDLRLQASVADKLGGARVAERINGALFSVNSLRTRVFLSGDIERPSVKLDSDVGPALARGINMAMQQELDYQRDKLVARADARLAQEATRFDTFVRQQQQQLLQKLEMNEKHIGQFQELLAERFGGAATMSAKRLLDNRDSIKNLIFK